MIRIPLKSLLDGFCPELDDCLCEADGLDGVVLSPRRGEMWRQAARKLYGFSEARGRKRRRVTDDSDRSS